MYFIRYRQQNTKGTRDGYTKATEHTEREKSHE